MIVGSSVIAKGIDITPSVGDITAERSFYGLNDQVLPGNVVGYSFTDEAIKSFTGVACVTTTTTDDVFDALYELKGLRKKSGWILNASYIGDHIGLKFHITLSGQVQYTSELTPNWLQTKIKFRAMTTTA